MASFNDAAYQSPWMYFLAGALLPTIAFAFLSWGQNRGTSASRTTAAPDLPSDDDDDSDDDGLTMLLNQKGQAAACAAWTYKDSPYKMVLCVNTDLSMGKGKIAAQCSHAAVGCYKRAAKACPVALQAWQRTGCAKIALKCPQEELELVAAMAMSKDIPCYLVEDAGRTQIAAGSRTVLGLFGPVHVFEGVTDHLKLM